MQTDDFGQQLIAYMRSINVNMVAEMNRHYHLLAVTPTQALVLTAVQRAGAMRVSDIASALNMPVSNISNTCRRLEKNGMVVRQRDEKDQRRVDIRLTEKACAMVEKIKEESETMNRKIIENTTSAEKETILAGLSVLDDVLKR